MKKLLIATAALAMVAGTAQAQSSVTVYGLLDMGYNSTEYTNNNNVVGKNGKTSTMGALSALSSSRLGFRGTEDLGGGTSAIFQLELGFQGQTVNNATTTLTAVSSVNGVIASDSATNKTDSSTNLNTAIDAARIFTVGLSDKALGTARIGRDKAPAQLATEKYTAGGANNSVGEFFMYDNGLSFDATNSNKVDIDVTKDTFGERVSGGLFYTSPTMSGFTLNAVVAKDKNADADGTASANRQVQNQGLSIAYEGIANLSVTYAMHTNKVRSEDATASTKNDYQTIGASYKLGNVQLFGQYVDAEKKGNTGLQVSKTDGYQVGAGYTMGKTYLWAQMGKADSEGTTIGTKEYERDGYQIGARYDLSKRTSLYGIYGAQEAVKVTASPNVTAEVKALNLGVRHSF